MKIDELSNTDKEIIDEIEGSRNSSKITGYLMIFCLLAFLFLMILVL